MVLLIACSNIANLTLARGISRGREWRSGRRLAPADGGLCASFHREPAPVPGGGVLGFLLAYAGLALMKATMPSGTIPANLQVVMDGRVLWFVVGLSVLTGVLFGIVPA